jgi:hypothetical protein
MCFVGLRTVSSGRFSFCIAGKLVGWGFLYTLSRCLCFQSLLARDLLIPGSVRTDDNRHDYQPHRVRIVPWPRALELCERGLQTRSLRLRTLLTVFVSEVHFGQNFCGSWIQRSRSERLIFGVPDLGAPVSPTGVFLAPGCPLWGAGAFGIMSG